MKHCNGPTHPEGGADLPLEAFHKHRGKRDGLGSRCRSCVAAAHKAWYTANPEVKRASNAGRSLEYMAARSAVTRAKNRAKWTAPGANPYNGTDKTCRRCGDTWPREEGQWCRTDERTDGLEPFCYSCRSDKAMGSRASVREAAAAYVADFLACDDPEIKREWAEDLLSSPDAQTLCWVSKDLDSIVQHWAGLDLQPLTIERTWPMGQDFSKLKKSGKFNSGFEDAVAKDLDKKGVSFEFEPQPPIKYDVPEKPSRFTVDFLLPNGIAVETIGRFTTADRGKMRLVKSQHPQLDLRLVFANSRQRISKDSATSYAMWCQRWGFKYADKSIPDAWLAEPAGASLEYITTSPDLKLKAK